MDFEEFNKETVPQINKELKKLLEEWRKEVGKIDKSLLPLVDKFIKANKGGKRIRGVLVVLGYQLAVHLPGVSLDYARDKQAHLEGEITKIAAAYEIFHTAILAHDDIMDQSSTRRGQPSLYQALGGDHQGISLAISLADAGFFLAGKIISESTAKPHLGGVKARTFRGDLTVKALKWFSQTMVDTSLGQILDIQQGDSLTVAKYKTAKYTISGPLVLGAILGGADGRLLGRLGLFGENLGIAFQIQDDILDAEVAWIGGVNSAKKAAEKYKDQAMKVLPKITKDKEMSKLLEQMAEYLVQRTK